MSYKTNITTTQKTKRDELKKQMDSFSTFMWRGENSFDSFGAFIITEKLGDLKFYNGPSFSNEYSKTQFNSSSGNLLGVSFNRQQISFKVGVYYFSISDWQNFLEWINPYEVNYLSFSYNNSYGYLVKLAKIEDTPRYVVGYDSGEPMYYTEITLAWDLQGDSCVRANNACEWKWEEIQKGYSCCFKENTDYPSFSLIETPFLLTFPIIFTTSTNKTHNITFKCGSKELFKVNFKSMPETLETTQKEITYILKETLDESDIEKMLKLQKTQYDFKYTSNGESHSNICILKDKGSVAAVYASYGTNMERFIYNTDLQLIPGSTIITSDFPEDLDFLVSQVSSPNDDLMDYDEFLQQTQYQNAITIQYDSETGVLLYKQGDSSWKLLHLNLSENEEGYSVSSFFTQKYKLQGNLSNSSFTLEFDNCTTPLNIEPLLLVYARTNVI